MTRPSYAMTRPSYDDGYRREEPRVIHTGWEDIYAAWCDNCGSDAETRWDMASLRREYPEAWCKCCERVLRPSRAEVYYIREPVRLRARLAELQAEDRRRSPGQSSEEPKP